MAHKAASKPTTRTSNSKNQSALHKEELSVDVSQRLPVVVNGHLHVPVLLLQVPPFKHVRAHVLVVAAVVVAVLHVG